jgi:hypothetical protein
MFGVVSMDLQNGLSSLTSHAIGAPPCKISRFGYNLWSRKAEK